MTTDLTLWERFQPVAEAIEAELLTYLQTVDPTIERLHFELGHPQAIIKSLMALNTPQSYQYQKYPLLAVFEDVPERALAPGLSVITPRIIIANQTRPEYTRQERDAKNFKPILLPIADAFDRHMAKSGLLGSNYRKPGERIMRPFWGREGLYGNEGNTFSDALDCIEIRNRELTIRWQPTCSPDFFKNF